MQIEIKIDSTCNEPKVIILTDKMTEDVNDIIKKLSETPPKILTGFREDTVEILEQSEIFRAYASEGKVFAVTNDGIYTLRLRLYELVRYVSKIKKVLGI